MSPQSGGGVGLGGLLFVVFLTLKLTKTIAWSWWWVTAPLWIPFAITIVVLSVVGAAAVALTRKR